MDENRIEKELGNLATSLSSKKVPRDLDNQTRMILRKQISRSKKKGGFDMPRLKTLGVIPLVALLMLVGFMSTIAILHFTASDKDLILDQQDLVMVVGEIFVLTVKDMGPDDLEWDSSDKTVAEVDQLGEVKAVGPGTAVITVMAGKRTASTNVVVAEPELQIQLNPNSLKLSTGETRQIQIERQPTSNVEPVVWTSEDIGVAEVDESGNVTAVSPGSTRIIASIAGKEAICSVSVTEPEPTELGKQIVAEVPVHPMGGSRLTFSPAGDRFIYFEAGAMNEEPTLFDLQGNGFHLSYNCGPVSWRGTRIVYYERLGWEEPPVLTIVIYDTQSNTYTRIDDEMVTSLDYRFNTSIKPVLSGDSTVSVIIPDGLWTYDLNQRSWTQVLTLEADDSAGWDSGVGPWPTVTWSPDYKKVAWLEELFAGNRLVLLDIDSGNKTKTQTQTISQIAWSGDSTKLAAAGGGNLTILSLEGDVIKSFPGPDSSPTLHPMNTLLSWVPGQDNKVAYNTEEGLIIRDVVTGQRWIVPDIRDYTWLQNGNLAHLSCVDIDDDSWVLEILKLDWH